MDEETRKMLLSSDFWSGVASGATAIFLLEVLLFLAFLLGHSSK